MDRLAATEIAVELANDQPIIGGVGNSTFDLVPFDRPRNFYMWNSMDTVIVNAVAQTRAGIEKPLRYHIYVSKLQT